MNKLIGTMLVIFFCGALLCSAQPSEKSKKEYIRALTKGAKTKATLVIADEEGNIITNATVTIGYLPPKAPNYIRDKYYSDSAGTVITMVSSIEPTGFFIEKEGYYSTSVKFKFGNPNDSSDYAAKVNNGRWLPWNPTIPVVLRKVQHPIPMYAMGVDFGKSFPCDEDIGFDCIARDWVAPHSSGKTADFMFRLTDTDLPKETEEKLANLLERQKTSTDKSELANIWIELRRIDMAYYKLVLSAPDKDGGFIKKQKLQYSHFMSDHQAPQTGYSQCFTISMGKLPYFEPPNPNDLLGDEYLIFKSRIVRDETGTIISANYGKIYGPMVHSISRKEREGGVNFRPYFNPVANDRNLEWNGIDIATGTKLGKFMP